MRLPRLARLALPLLCAASAGTILRAAEPASVRAPALGLIPGIGVDATALPEADSPGGGRGPYVRLTADWARVETDPGVYDWSAFRETAARWRGAGFRVVVCLAGTHPSYLPAGGPPSPTEGKSLDGWVSFARSAVRSLGDTATVFEIGEAPDSVYSAETYAFVLKTTALAIRAEARAAGIETLVAQGSIDVAGLAWQQELWRYDTAAYVDILPVRLAAGGSADVASDVERVLLESANHPPASTLWAYVRPAEGAAPREVLGGTVRALGGSAAAAFATLEAADGERELRWIRALHARLDDGFVPAPLGGLTLRTPGGEAREDFRLLGRFLRARDFQTLVVYEAPGRGDPAGQARLILDTIDAKEPRVIDPITGADLRTGPAEVPGATRRALRLLLADYPMVVLWDRAAANLPGLEPEAQDLDVEGTRGLTAEEIIARYQQVQKVQDDRLERFTAQGRVDFHFKFAQTGSTFDVSIVSQYFWERGGALEWEQTEYYVNGNKVTWKNMPELPLVQPEKVVTLPLDLTLDRTYVYRLVGEDEVAGRPAYVLAFEPADPSAPLSLYRGRVWIDKETFERVKASVVQTNLEAPVLSNDETDLYTIETGTDGLPYRVLTAVDGQQLWTAGGRNFVVRRELRFDRFEINLPKPQFDERRARAYASSNQMLRDTDQGFRYLRRQEDGTREVSQTVDSDQFFFFGGLFHDSATALVPLAGINYFDYDFRKRNEQINVLFAGVFVFATWTDPALAGKRVDATVDLSGVALKRDDKRYVDGEEVESERTRRRTQFGDIRFGFPMGSFFKLTLVGEFAYNEYDRADEADPAFVTPTDHVEAGASAVAEWNRRGWSLTGSATWTRRSRWEPWGLPGNEDYDPARQSYTTWGLTAFKEWYLPKFQKIRAEANFLDGTSLDRFSAYNISYFGRQRLAGFSGTGVRFDRGYFLRTGYSFNLLSAVRFDATVETARVLDRRSGSGYQDFTGLGLAGNFLGPGKTVFQIEYGRALASDIPELKGKQEFLFGILKLF